MGYANIFVASPCNIAVKNRQLVIQGEEIRRFALEDVNCLMVESHECNVSTYALQALAEAGAAVFVCDRVHMPCGVMLPYKSHFRQLASLRLQLDAPKPLQKRLWQSIVERKISNQARCCALATGSPAGLDVMAKNVLSGDSGNKEAVAAALHFRTLFGGGFSRQDEGNGVNALLNYSYAIMRGLIARTLAVYGFEGSIGLHHSNTFNAFNLADDLIEPFRPVADLFVHSAVEECGADLTPQMKRSLFSLTAADVEVNGQVHSLSYAVELEVQSLARSLKEQTVSLALPSLLPVAVHRYE